MTNLQPLRGKFRIAFVLAVSVGLVTTACSGNSAGSPAGGTASSNGLPVVKLMVLSGGMSAIGLKAVQESQSDIKNGFKGEFNFVDGDTENQFFLQHKADIDVGLDPIQTALFRNENNDVSTFYQYQPNYACLVSQSKYNSPNDLVGKKVGNTGPGSGTTQSVAVTLQAFWNISLTKDYIPVQAAPQVLVEMLKSKEIEAATLYEPYSSRAIVQGKAKCLTGLVGDVWAKHVGGQVSYTSLVAFNDWIDKNPKSALAATQAMTDGIAWLKADPKRIEKEPFLSMIGSNDPAILARLEGLIADGSLYDATWSPEIIKANTQLLTLLAKQGVLLKKIPDGVFRTLAK